MMTEYHWQEFERAQEVEKRGRYLFGNKWKPSRWHIKIILKFEAETHRMRRPSLKASLKGFSTGWSTRRNKRNRLKQKKINVDK